MTRSLKCLVAVAALTVGACQSAGGVTARGDAGTASSGEDRRIVTELTGERMKRSFTDEGFTDVRIDDDGDVIARMNGYQVIAFVQENDHPVLRYYFAIAGTDATLVDLDEWNRERYFTKAYMDNEGDPVLEMVVNLEGGITVANLRHSIRTYSQALTAFLAVLQETTA